MSYRDDLHALSHDGVTDGLVNSDQSYDEALEMLERGFSEKEILETAQRLRTLSLLRDIARFLRTGEAYDDIPELITTDEHGSRRSREDQKSLASAYLTGWKSGFQSRWKQDSPRFVIVGA
jgi:hypothetical protein